MRSEEFFRGNTYKGSTVNESPFISFLNKEVFMQVDKSACFNAFSPKRLI